MAYPFGSLVFTPVIKALQERYGSRRQYAKRELSGFAPPGLGPGEREFLAEADSFYMASIGESGWPYIQHRGGPKGFLKVVDDRTIAFGDYGGNRQYVSTGNLMANDRVTIILVDYPRQARLKILGHARILEGTDAKEWMETVHTVDATPIERVFLIQIEAFDWNCHKHITPRFTEEQIRDVLGAVEEKISLLQQENQKLRAELATCNPVGAASPYSSLKP